VKADQTSEPHGLKRELRLIDLVLLQVLLVVGLSWVGSAAKQGSTHVVLWLAGILFFYLPLGAVVILLSRAIPVEGGTYQWVKAGISPFAGYLAVWNTSFYTIVILGTQGPMLINSLAYIVGPRGVWMMNSTPIIVGAAALCLLATFLVNVRGLHLGKWITGSGSTMNILLAVLMVYLLLRRWVSGVAPAYPPFSLAMPALSILTLNVFTKMSIGALSGFDNAGVFAGECRVPGRDLPRSVLFSAPLIAVMYILGTGALLAYVSPDKADLAAPLQQLIQAGFGNSGLGGILTTTAICATTLTWLAQVVALMAMASRFPMVIGWDGLLPPWWSDLHSRFGTPVKALAVVTAACLLITLMSSWGGAGGQEIFQIGSGAGTSCLCIMYALLFSAALIGKPSAGLRPGTAIRLAALSGFVVSVVSLPFQVVPLAGVPNPAVFGLKVGGLVCAINALGAWLYWRGKKRLQPRGRDLVNPTQASRLG
jgi:glutamate:GABA antiporter